jgi:PAS domain S-box-containing protein
MLAAASPIVPRTGSAASRGTFMVGRFLTPSQIAAVGDRAAATVELFLVSAADVPPEVREAAESAAGPAVREGSDGRLAGYAVIDDISGAPALVARVTPRGDDAAPGEVLANASRQASAADLWLGLLLVGSALIVLGTVLLVLETAFLGRTFALTTRLNEIAAAPAPGSRAEAHGDDELARLELAANEALAAVEGAGRKTGEREKALAAAVERSRLALQAAGLLVFDVDVQAGRISFDGAVTRVTGYNLEELASVPLSTWEGMVHPDDRPSAVAAGEQAASAGLSYRIEYRLKRKDGSYVTVEDRGARVPGATVKVVGIVHLVPQRHAAEQAPPAAGPAS